MIENTIAWKMLNLEKSFTSYVEKVVKNNNVNELFAEYDNEVEDSN